MLSPLPATFRARWPHHPEPMVLMHRAGEPEHICPAPTLWTGGKVFRESARALGLGPGHRVVAPMAPGIRWVQAMVGCFRAGVCFIPLPPETDQALIDALRPHARVADTGLSLVVADAEAPLSDAEARWGFVSPTNAPTLNSVFDEQTLMAFAERLSSGLCPAPGIRVLSQHPWWTPLGAIGEVLPTLWGAGELHLKGPGVGAEQLDASSSSPQATTGRARFWRDALNAPPAWGTTLTGGLLFDADPDGALQQACSARGWRLQVVEEMTC
ncbi:MAG: hypothetical protein ACE366_20340 [Bradymonadia bacterium]